MKKKILVAMSGGVDSSVAALLLKEKGYDVAGVTMRLGFEKADSSIEASRTVAKQISIPHRVLDFSGELEEKVIQNFVSEYSKGKTPNPCILCNKHIKFGTLLKKALSTGYDFLATGHYARIEKSRGRYVLKKSQDPRKDQSYFLYGIEKKALKNILFPLGFLAKEDVRGIAGKEGLPFAERGESQDLCFTEGGTLRDFFLKRSAYQRPGNILNSGRQLLGRHRGSSFYTVGQRRGMGIGSKGALYVVSVDTERNEIIAGEKKDLKAQGLIAGCANFFTRASSGKASAKIRYASGEVKCSFLSEGREIKVVFDENVEAITPGQSVVLYRNETVLGGGIIKAAIK